MEPNQIPTTERPTRSFFSMPIIIALFVLLFLLVVFMYGKIQSTTAPANLAVETNLVPEESKAIVYKADVNAEIGKERLPEGFPTNIPVETDSVEQSLKTEYPEKGMIQYSVTYTTEKTIEEVRDSYRSFFTNDDYVIYSEVANPVQIYSNKSGDDVSVVIETNEKGKTRVFVNYLDRK